MEKYGNFLLTQNGLKLTFFARLHEALSPIDRLLCGFLAIYGDRNFRCNIPNHGSETDGSRGSCIVWFLTTGL